MAAGTQKSDVSSATLSVFSLAGSPTPLFSQRVEELPSEQVGSGVTQENSIHTHLWHPRGGVQGAVRIG